MIKTIIFDFGDVLVKDTTKTLEKKFKFEKAAPAKRATYIKAFHESEIGKIGTTELLRVMHACLSCPLTPKEVENFIIHTKILPAWPLALKLAKNYRILIFSNNQKLWPKKISLLLKTDFFRFPFVNSAYIKRRKPEPATYRYFMKKFNIKPNETIFIDDKEQNLAPAKHLGWHTFHYQNNPGELKASLKKLGVKI